MCRADRRKREFQVEIKESKDQSRQASWTQKLSMEGSAVIPEQWDDLIEDMEVALGCGGRGH